MDVDDVQAVLAKSRQLLHEQRTQRPRPHLDDKVSKFTQSTMLGVGAASWISRRAA